MPTKKTVKEKAPVKEFKEYKTAFDKWKNFDDSRFSTWSEHKKKILHRLWQWLVENRYNAEAFSEKPNCQFIL